MGSNTRKVTKHNRSEAWEDVLAAAKADADSAPPTRRCHERAAMAVAHDPGMLGARGERVLGGAVLALALLVVVLALSGCATLEPETVDSLRAGLAHNLVTAEDPRMSPDAREEAALNADLDAVILRDWTGEALPPEVQARLDAFRAGGGR